MQLDLDFHKTLQAGARSFDLRIRLQSPSKRVVIHGPSGAGKSMTLKAIAGLLTPDSGHIRMAGHTVFDAGSHINVPARARRVGYLFQDYALFPHLTVKQNIAFGTQAGWLNPSRAVRDQRVQQWLELMGLQDLANQYPHDLSGGQRQRTALARALVTHPDVLLLDEPFAALDAQLRRAMRVELLDLQRRLDVPMILITHDPDDVAALGEAVFRMENGQVLLAG